MQAAKYRRCTKAVKGRCPARQGCEIAGSTHVTSSDAKPRDEWNESRGLGWLFSSFLFASAAVWFPPEGERMRRFAPQMGWTCLLLAGCITTPTTERVQIFNDDGVYLFAQGQYREALENFELALTIQPADAGLLF